MNIINKDYQPLLRVYHWHYQNHVVNNNIRNIVWRWKYGNIIMNTYENDSLEYINFVIKNNNILITGSRDDDIVSILIYAANLIKERKLDEKL